MVKKEFTSFDVAAVVRELKDTNLDSRVSNVYQIDVRTLLLKLHKPDKPAFSLVLEAGRRLHLTSFVLEKPMVPPAFCMALRKYLRNSWLISVEQYEFERVVLLSFRTKEGAVQLVMELFGDGNFILLNQKRTILQALSYKRMRDRNVLRGESFAFAPPSGKNPFKATYEELLVELRRFGDIEVVRVLARLLSIGGFYAEEVLLRAGVDKTRLCNTLLDAEVSTIFGALQSLLLQLSTGKPEPCIFLDEKGEFVDVAPFRLKRFEGAGFKLQPCPSFNEALDEFYVRVCAFEKAAASHDIDKLRLEADRLKRMIESQEKTLSEAESKADHDRRVGNVIYEHSSEVQALIDRFLEDKQRGKPWNVIVSEVLTEKGAGNKPGVLFESLDHKNLIVNMCVDDLKFSLDLRKNLFENAAAHYEHGKRAKQKLEGAKLALEDSRRQLGEIQAKIKEAEDLERVRPIEAVEKLAERKVKRKEWFEKFRWFVSSDGFLVVGGKDAVSNEVLIKKHTDESDVVFHADIIGAPFVVVKASGHEPSEQCLREAGEFAAAFSRGWREGFASVDVYCVRPDQLSKAGLSGESVGHGAFVVRGERHWFRGTPLKQSVGVIVDEGGKVRFVGGPVDAVRTKTKALVVIGPEDLSGKDLTRRVLGALAAKVAKDVREKVLKASIEEIREHIPYGKGRILET